MDQLLIHTTLVYELILKKENKRLFSPLVVPSIIDSEFTDQPARPLVEL